MTHYTVRLEGDLDATVSQCIAEHEGSKSDALRDLIRKGTVYADTQRENERLRRAQTQLIEQREEHGELVEYVHEERSMQQRQQDRRDAPAWTRFRYWLFGRSD